MAFLCYFQNKLSELLLGVLRQESRVIAESGAVADHPISHHDDAFDEAVVVLEVRALVRDVQALV